MKYLLLALMLAGCCQGGNLALESSPSDLDVLINEYNNTRISQGQDPVTQGLNCTLYNVLTTTTAIIGATGLVGVGSFLYLGNFAQPNANINTGFDVLPSQLQSIVQSWFIVKCTGVIAFPEDGWHSFSTTSDDGSNLYVNGLIVNNDGLHAATTKSASKFLPRGVYSFELDFLQGGGFEQLAVNIDGNTIPEANLWH